MNIELSRYRNVDIDIQTASMGYYDNGHDNLFSNYLNGLFNNSPTHQSIIEDLVGYIIGQGLESDNPKDAALIKKHFNKEFLDKLETYRKIQSTVCILVCRDALFRINKLEVLNPEQIRVAQLKDGKPCRFKYRKSWDNRVNFRYRDEVEIPAYDKFSEKSLLYWYNSGTFDVPYGRPSYISGLNAIEFEASLYMGDNHGAQNGLTPSAIVTMPTSGDENQDKASANSITGNLAGVSNKGKVATVFTKAGETAPPTVTLLNDNSTESKETNYRVAEAGILKAWRIPSPTLISGLNIKPTGFGDAEAEMQWAKNTLKSKVIEPNRVVLLKILEVLFKDFEFTSEPQFINEVERNEAVQEEVVEQSVNDNIKNLTGRQQINFDRILRKFGQGKITEEQAKIQLRSGFGLSEEEIDTLLNVQTKLSKVLTLDDIIDNATSLDVLEEWEIESIEDAGSYDEELIANHNLNVELARTGTARPNSRTEQSGKKGNVQYKILYEYTGNENPQREFCRKMMAANKLYRFEDIKQMASIPVNEGFGINGASTYDIFSYKGGPNCKHKWKRITLVMKGDKNINAFNPNSPAINKISESQADERRMIPTGEAREKQRKSETIPYNMPNRGYFRGALQKLKDIING